MEHPAELSHSLADSELKSPTDSMKPEYEELKSPTDSMKPEYENTEFNFIIQPDMNIHENIAYGDVCFSHPPTRENVAYGDLMTQV